MTALVMLGNDAQVCVRPMRDADVPFIQSSWKQSYVFSVAHDEQAQAALFSELNHRCGRLLKRSEVRVACDPDNEDHVFGWACLDTKRQLLHYVVVKQKLRGRGIARVLLAGLKTPVVHTHWTFACEKYGRSGKAIYEPSRLREVMKDA